MPQIFKNTVVYIICSDATKKADIRKKLKENGAGFATRLTKSVSHCVFEKSTSETKSEERDIVLDVYQRIDALPIAPVFVSTSWIEECIAKKKMLSHNKFVIARPNDSKDEQIESQSRPRRNTRAVKKIATSPLQQQHAGEGTDVGLQTQAVAEILAIDLPANKDAGNHPAVNAQSRTTKHFVGSQRPAATKGRSRLANASGPSQEEDTHQTYEDTRAHQKTDSTNKMNDKNTKKNSAPAIFEGAAARFSVRQMQRYVEKPVLLHRGTPWPSAMPPPTVQQKKKSKSIFIPGVDKVESPWNASTPSQDDLSQHQDLFHPFGTQSNVKKGRKSSGSTPWTHLRAINLMNSSDKQSKKLPSPWTAARPWDTKRMADRNTAILGVASQDKEASIHETEQKQEQKADAEHCTGVGEGATEEQVMADVDYYHQQVEDNDENAVFIEDSTAPHNNAHMKKKSDECVPAMCNSPLKASNKNTTTTTNINATNIYTTNINININNNKKNASTKRIQQTQDQQAKKKRRVTIADQDTVIMAPSSSHPSVVHGHIAVTSTTSSVIDLVKSASRRLRGMRVCPDGQEEHTMTHLVIGEERRTLKAMLGVAHGAWLVSPEWVTASLEAGEWQPEEQYVANVRFAVGAERARRVKNSNTDNNTEEGCKKLLSGESVHVHLSSKGAARNAAALKRIASALGAKIVPLNSCTICVIAGGGDAPKRPAGLSRTIPSVKEEWLLQAAEQYEIMPLTRKFIVV